MPLRYSAFRGVNRHFYLLRACERCPASPFNSPCWYRNRAAFDHGLVREWKHYAGKYHKQLEHSLSIDHWCVKATVFSDFFV